MKKTEDANKRIAKQAAASKSMESPWRLAMKRSFFVLWDQSYLRIQILQQLILQMQNSRRVHSTGLEQMKMDETSLPVFFMEDVFP